MVNLSTLINFNINNIIQNYFFLFTSFIIIWLIYLLVQPYYINYKFNQKTTRHIEKPQVVRKSQTPTPPQPPKPPKKNWTEKLKDHFSKYKEIYIGSCIIIISLTSVIYYYDLSFYDFLNFFKTKKRPEGENPFDGFDGRDTSSLYQTPRSILGIPSGSLFLWDENSIYMSKYAMNLKIGFTQIVIDQIKVGLLHEAEHILEHLSDILIQYNLSYDINQSNTSSQNQISTELMMEDVTSESSNSTEPMMEDVIPERSNSTEPMMEDVIPERSTRADFMMADVIAESSTSDLSSIRDLMSTQLDRYIDNMNSQLNEETDRYFEYRISQETDRYLAESMLEETNTYLTNAIFQEALESSVSNDLNPTSNLNSSQYASFFNKLFEKELGDEEFNQLVSEFRTYTNPSFNQEQESRDLGVSQESRDLGVSQEPMDLVAEVPEIRMNDIRSLQRHDYPDLSYEEIIDSLIFEHIGTPTPLKELLENGELTELGFGMLDEETRLVYTRFHSNILNYVIENFLKRTELTDGIQLNRLVLQYIEANPLLFEDPAQFDHYIQRIHQYLIHEDPLVSNYLNSLESEEVQSRESEIIYHHIAATIFNEYAQYTGFPFGVPVYEEINNLIQLYLVLQKYFEFPDLNTVQLLALAVGY